MSCWKEQLVKHVQISTLASQTVAHFTPSISSVSSPTASTGTRPGPVWGQEMGEVAEQTGRVSTHSPPCCCSFTSRSSCFKVNIRTFPTDCSFKSPHTHAVYLSEFRKKLLHCDVQQDVGHLRTETEVSLSPAVLQSKISLWRIIGLLQYLSAHVVLIRNKRIMWQLELDRMNQ